jgi:outer membrane protein insertion porin family
MRTPHQLAPRKPRFRATNRAAAALICCLAAAGFARAQEASIEGQPVTEVRIVDESGRSITGNLPALPLQPGKPFEFEEERASLRALYQRGDYSDIRVTAESVAGGLAVKFIVRRNFYNNVVRIEGLVEPPTEAAAVAAMRLGLGLPFRESALKEGVNRLTEVLRTEGLYEAKLSWELRPHDDTRQIDIVVHIDSGPRARVGDFTVENRTPYPSADLLRRSKITGKNEMTAARLTRGSQRIKKYLVNQGYLGAGALITPGTYDAATNRVPLHFEVTAGPRVRLEVSGARLSKGKLQKLLPIYAEGGVDEDLLQEGRRNIRDYFQREGYFDAEVAVSSREGADRGERIITYEISRGDKFRVAGIAFDGNHYFSDALLSGRLQLQTASFAANGRFSQQLLRADTDSIRVLYQSNGFRDVQVNSDIDRNYRGKKGSLFVAFHIVEGVQMRVAGLTIEGNHAIDRDKLLSVVGSTLGQPYSDADVASDRNNILAMYYNDGYPDVRFQADVVPADTPERVQLVYRVTEGEKIDVSKVLITGYENTRRSLIERQVTIQAGGPLREGDVVETQRRLYNLGVFSRVVMAPQNPDGTDPEKTMVVDLQEGKRYTIGYGGGFEVQRISGGSNNPNGTTVGASPRGLFEISRANMFGRAQTLSFKARASSLEYRAALTYTADNFLDSKRFTLQLTAFADKSQDVNTFTSTRYEGAFQVVETLSRSSSLLYRYFFRRVTASELKIAPEEIPLLSQPTLVSGFGVTYARDHRDNPADPKSGTFNTADASIALRSLGSSASFFRGFFQNTSYHHFGRAFVFARSVRFGVEEPLDGTTEAEIPLPERFFAGGGASLRGFGLNQAGPRDRVTGFPVGGLALLAFNQEIRFPMNLPFIGNRLGGTLLYDAGNVFTDLNHISFAWKPPANNNLAYFSHTVGFGVRYPTPIGPVRVDLGYQINPASYVAVVPPSIRPETLHLPHFQFFFNIGPVF